MRNPLPVLAVALLAAAGAFAADLPTWQTTDEPFGAWRPIQFSDASGGPHYLYCRWSQCGANVTSGQAPLYVFEKAGDEPYTASEPYRPQYAQTYAGKSWEWLKGKTTNVQFQSTKTTFKTQLSRFALDMSSKPNKAVIKGTAVAIPVDAEHEAVSPTGWIFRVLPPAAVADDAPKAAPVPPAEPNPKPKPKPKPVPLPKPRPKVPPSPEPAPKTPATTAAPELIPLERGWLIPTERTLYDDAINEAKKPTAAALAAAYKDARAKVALNLRDELKKPYNDLVKAGKFDQIEGLLTNKNYTGWDVQLKPEEYQTLLTVLKTPTAHADFAAPNAAAQYDIEMKTILENGKPKLTEHLLAHRITEKFRAMLPGAKPGTTPSGAPVMLTKDAFGKIPNEKDREDLWTAYQGDWAKADTDDAKRAVNETYLKKIADKIAASVPKTPTTPKTPAHWDFNNTRTLAEFNLHLQNDADKQAFCAMLTPGTGGGMDDCGDILNNAAGAMQKCNPPEGVKKDAATLKAQSDCVAKVNACQAPAKASPAAPAPTPANGVPTQAIKEACAAYNAGAHGSGDHPKVGAGDIGADKPLPGEVTTDGKKKDDNFWPNVGNGLATGIGGLLLASFFGGPLLMLAVAVTAGVGAYYLSKSITNPPDDKGKKK